MIREIVARSRRLEESPRSIDVHVTTWSSVRPAIETLSDSDPSVSPTVDAFQDWAESEGYTLGPAFEQHQTPSRLGRDAVAEIRVPVVCVAVYVNDDLISVAPCSDGDRAYTVEQCLAALETGEIDPFPERHASRHETQECSDESSENTALESE